MTTASSPVLPDRPLAILEALLRRDRLAQSGAILLFVLTGTAALSSVFPLPEPLASGYIPFAVPALLMLSFFRGITGLSERRERLFWWVNVVAMICWLGAEAVVIGFNLASGEGPPQIVLRLLFAVLFVFLVIAPEFRPHRPPQPMPGGLEQFLVWPSAAFFVLGLVVYFLVIPVVSGSLSGPDALSGLYFNSILDAYLSLRFAFLLRDATSRRWRMIYGFFVLAWGIIFLTNLNTLGVRSVPAWPIESFPGWWLNLAFLAVILGSRLRHLPGVEDRESLPKVPRLEASFLTSAQTLAFAVAFPVLHILVSRYGLLDAMHRESRDFWVLVCLVVFGALALAQHRLYERRGQELWLEQVAFEEKLRSDEQDLRLIIERNKATNAKRSAEQKFDLAFRACPSGLAISARENGRLLEVNPAFEALFGVSRNRIVGRSTKKLGLWENPRDFVRLRRRLTARHEVRELELDLRRVSGEPFRAGLSATHIELDGEELILSVVREIPCRDDDEERRGRRAALFEQAREPMFFLDAAGCPCSWNAAAEERLGWSAEKVVGRPAHESFDPEGHLDAAVSDGSSVLELQTADGRTLRFDAFSSSVESECAVRLVVLGKLA